MCIDLTTIDDPIHEAGGAEPAAPSNNVERPFYCLRCARQHPPTSTHCNCRTPPVPLKSKNHPELVKEWCTQGMLRIAYPLANRFTRENERTRASRGGRLDFESEAAHWVLSAALRHDENLGSFFSLAYEMVLWGLRGYARRIRTNLATTREVPSVRYGNCTDAELASDADIAEVNRREEFAEVQQAIIKCLTPEEAHFAKHLIQDMQLPQIADAAKIGFVAAFQLKDRVVNALRNRLQDRLSMKIVGDGQSPWHSSILGLSIFPEDRQHFESVIGAVLTRTERMAVYCNLVEGISITDLAKRTHTSRGEMCDFLFKCVEKLKPYVSFQSRAEWLDAHNLACVHCRKGRKGHSRGLCQSCCRNRSIRDLYETRHKAKREQGSEEQPDEAGKTKVCNQCNTEKPIVEFAHHRQSIGGRRAKCAACESRRARARYAAKKGSKNGTGLCHQEVAT